MKISTRFAIPCLAAAFVPAGCSSATVRFDPPSPGAVCAPAQRGLLLWTTRWRPDHKDVADREAAAAEGIRRFAMESGCFSPAQAKRIAASDGPALEEALRAALQAPGSSAADSRMASRPPPEEPQTGSAIGRSPQR